LRVGCFHDGPQATTLAIPLSNLARNTVHERTKLHALAGHVLDLLLKYQPHGTVVPTEIDLDGGDTGKGQPGNSKQDLQVVKFTPVNPPKPQQELKGNNPSALGPVTLPTLFVEEVLDGHLCHCPPCDPQYHARVKANALARAE